MNYYLDCVNRPRPCPWVGCKWHLYLDVNPETGAMVFNMGQVKESAAAAVASGRHRTRLRQVERRIGTVSPKGKNTWSKGHAQFLEAEAKLFETLHEDVECDGGMTCLLDAVEGGTTYTLEQVGAVFSVTRERVRQVEVIALRQIRHDHKEVSDIAAWADSI